MLKIQRRSAFFFFLAVGVASAVESSGCGGDPAGPSGDLTLQGLLVPGDAAARAASSGRITITLGEDDRISTTAALNGTFALHGLPAGGFSLVFTSDGANLGRIGIPPVDGATEIEIVVQVTSSRVTLLNSSA